ncbi:phage attachment tail tip protein J [Escherichia coli]|uniref:phage attachment tail tip protein J n=2 Tax=Escherichia coli TaxID=562 RepID=UPI0005CDAADD|nr:host specificity protein J [Escherichia coli]
MGGKNKKKQSTPYEEPDNLKSVQELSFIDAIGEGPIEGLVKGMQSILINNTPLVNDDDSYNVHGVTAIYNAGEQEQTPLEGFEDTGVEVMVNAEIKQDAPITRTITAQEIDRLRITFGTPYLQESNNKGDRLNTSLHLVLQIQRADGWVTVKDIYINGKTTSQFLASVVLEELPPRPFNVRMVRVTPDSTTDQLQNKSTWSSYTEITDLKQAYPNTVVVGLKVAAEQFGNQQVTINYHIYGRIVQVPSNYDPKTRTYTGIWNGVLKPAYTSNPAWCLLDMLTHPRYGMGGSIGISEVDKWALYAIAQYCDQMIPDGFGGTEPRMTFNAYLATQRKAYDVLADFCSVMRCMPVWNGRTLTFIQDRPADKVWTYTNSNVVTDSQGVQFRYSYSARKDRHNAVEVRYTDPQNGWKTSTLLVEDKAAILRDGRNLLKMDAFGCTSRGQAHRAGLWVIKTEQLETQTVEFSVGAEGLRHTPGDIIEVCDNDYAAVSIGGRILSVDAMTRTLTLDREVEIPKTGVATLNIIGADGKPVTVDVTGQPAPDRVTVSNMPAGIAAYSVWGLKLPSLRQRLFRCIRIKESSDGTYAITALQHVPEKEAIVDNGAHFDPLPGTTNSVVPPTVEHLTVTTEAEGNQYQARAHWDTPRVVKGVRFLVRLTTGSGQDDDPVLLVDSATTSDTEYTFRALPLGDYTLTVRAINGFGQQGEPAQVDFSIRPPEAPVVIELTPGYFQITVTPHQTYYQPDVQYEFWYSIKQLNSADEITSSARRLGVSSYMVKDGLKPLQDHYFYVRSVNLVGKSAFAEAVGQASRDAQGYLDFFAGEIQKTHLAQELFEQIDNSLLEDDIAEISKVVDDTKSEIEQTVNKTLEDQSATIQQIQKVQKDTNDNLNALYMLKIQKTKDGVTYVAGIGAGIEEVDGEQLSQILLAANRVAFIDPANGNTTPALVTQGGQTFINEALIKFLSATVINAPTITSGGNPPVFSLAPDGKLTAKNADFSGNINANSGTLNNVTVNQNCRILGKLSANQIEGDLVKTVGKAFPRNGSYASGTVTVTIYDDQPFDRQIIIPPVLFRGAKHEINEVGNAGIRYWYSTCQLQVLNNGQVIFHQPATDSSGVFSAAIDMPAGKGHVTLTFNVFSNGSGNRTPTTSISELLVVVMKKSTAGISIS